MKVLLIEDDAKLGKAISRILTRELHDVQAAAAARACVVAERGSFEVIVLDAGPADAEGIGLCRDLRRRGIATPLLVLSERAEPRDRVAGLRAGADDYLGRPFEAEELCARVEALGRRGRNVLAIGGLEIDRGLGRAFLRGARLDLTSRELALLSHLAAKRGEVVGRAELLREIWNTTFDPGTTVVEVQMSRLREKLRDHAGLIETIRGRGYRLRLEPP